MVDGLIFGAITNLDGSKPLGLSRTAGAHRIATTMRKLGLNIEVIDYFNYWTISELKALIQSRCNSKTLFIGWSVSFYSGSEKVTAELIPWIRDRFPNIKLILGGTHTHYNHFPKMDYHVNGFAEGAIEEILLHMQGKPNQLHFETLPDGGIVIDALKHYKKENWGDLSIEYENRDFISAKETLTLEVSRGCVFQCKFCSFPITGKKRNDHLRTPQMIRDELYRNYERYGITSYVLSEETVNDSEDKLQMMAKALQGLCFQPEFRGFFRLDLLHRYPHTLQLLKDINVTGMHFGIETFHQKAGLAIGKGLDPEKNKETLKQVRNVFGNRLIMLASFIIGLPFEDKDSILKTQDWLMSSENPMDSWVWYPLTIYDPNSRMKSSYFSKNYEKFGYRLKKTEGPYSPILNWENDITDYENASQLALELFKHSSSRRRLGPWAIGACKSLGIDETEYIHRTFAGPQGANIPLLRESANIKAQEYKQKKLQTEINLASRYDEPHSDSVSDTN